jgi:hypothetical protein
LDVRRTVTLGSIIFRGVLKRRPDRTRIELTPRIVADQILDHLRQAGVTPQISIIYLLLRSRNFIFGVSVMNSTIPVDILELKACFETWRTNRIWSWMDDHEHDVSAAEWTKENPGRLCLFFSQDGPWAIMMDPSYTLASDQKAQKTLSEKFGTALAFVVESVTGCASFVCYERGQLRRAIHRLEGDMKTEGTALPEEKGIEVNDYYMDETESLMRAFGLSFLETFPIPTATIAIEVTDRTDYSQSIEMWLREDE